MIGLEHYLTVAAVLFVIGIFGLFLNRKNVIILLMSLELILLSVNINMVAFSSYLGDLAGQVFTLFILSDTLTHHVGGGGGNSVSKMKRLSSRYRRGKSTVRIFENTVSATAFSGRLVEMATV